MTSLPDIRSRPPAPARTAADMAHRPSAPPKAALGSWMLTQVIHRGRWNTLYRARPAASSDGPGCYAIKTSAAGGERGKFARAMLGREAVVAAEVGQANLATVLASHVHCDQPYLVLPFLEGLTLRQLVDTKLKLIPAATSLWIVRQVAQALAGLHGAGWLHGQVRTEHVVVSPQGHATLIDLALCRRLDTAECASEGAAPLTTSSVAPESCLSRGRLTQALDTYCLGLMLFELLAGHPPFTAADPRKLVEMHRRQSPPDIRALRHDAPPEVAHLLRLMLAKEPLRRPSDEELVRWLADLEIAALL